MSNKTVNLPGSNDASVSTPGTGRVKVYVDSTTKRLRSKNDAGVVTDYAGGATSLSNTASPTTVTVESDTGSNTNLPLANGTNAGLMAPAQHTKLAGIEDGADANTILESKVYGLESEYVSDTQFMIKSGSIYSQNKNRVLELTADTTYIISDVLDTGSLTASTWYFAYLVWNTSSSSVECLVSTSSSAPTLGANQVDPRLVTVLYYDSSSDIVKFKCRGKGYDKDYIYTIQQILLSNGGATSYTAISCVTAIPQFSDGYPRFDASFEHDSTDVRVWADGETAINDIYVYSDSGTGGHTGFVSNIIPDTSGNIHYQGVGGDPNLWFKIQSFKMRL